ncbi:hypothetical protein M5K25_014959 [Dendrobium thyrsiflorum]|uniref:Uncharacterized protein n=1 Tax=Dendrobium thyrsiflorum TaxID=117978 RepID=A0ABD0UP44_DENTH
MLDFRQSQDSCLVARLSPVVGHLPVVGLSSDIYPTLNFLRSPDFCPSSDSHRTSACRRTSATLDFRQSPDFCLVARLSPVVGLLPVVGLSSDIYPTLNFLRSPDFCPSSDSRRTSATLDSRQSQDSCLVARLSPVVGLLPVVGLSSDIYLTLNFLRSSDFCPSSDYRRTSACRRTSAMLDFRQSQDSCLVARISSVVGHLPVVGLSSDIYPTLNFLRSPDFRPSLDFCPSSDFRRTSTRR